MQHASDRRLLQESREEIQRVSFERTNEVVCVCVFVCVCVCVCVCVSVCVCNTECGSMVQYVVCVLHYRMRLIVLNVLSLERTNKVCVCVCVCVYVLRKVFCLSVCLGVTHIHT